MPYTDADIRFYHGQRKKNQGFSKDSTEEFGYSQPHPEKDRDKWIEEFGEERMKDEEWLKWYLQRKRNQGDLDRLTKKYQNWHAQKKR